MKLIFFPVTNNLNFRAKKQFLSKVEETSFTFWRKNSKFHFFKKLKVKKNYNLNFRAKNLLFLPKVGGTSLTFLALKFKVSIFSKNIYFYFLNSNLNFRAKNM